MEQRELGTTGINVSRIILGCGNFGGIGSAPEFFGQGESEAEAVALLGAAWDSGITTLDTADAYGGGRSEAYIGRWLAKQSSRVRDNVVVATKLYHSVEGDPTEFGLAPERVARCIDESRERLGLERIPLYLTHQPDPTTPIEATLRELARQVERGAVGAVGASNIDAEELRRALAASRRIGLDEYASTLEQLKELAGAHAVSMATLAFIHPVQDESVMAGNATIGLEILEDLPEPDAILVPYGGGGLACGIAALSGTSHPTRRSTRSSQLRAPHSPGSRSRRANGGRIQTIVCRRGWCKDCSAEHVASGEFAPRRGDHRESRPDGGSRAASRGALARCRRGSWRARTRGRSF